MVHAHLSPQYRSVSLPLFVTQIYYHSQNPPPSLHTVRPLPPLLRHTVAITRPPSHSLPHPSAPAPSAWSHTQLHCCTLTRPLCNTHAVPRAPPAASPHPPAAAGGGADDLTARARRGPARPQIGWPRLRGTSKPERELQLWWNGRN